jgi:hypothetical protein
MCMVREDSPCQGCVPIAVRPFRTARVGPQFLGVTPPTSPFAPHRATFPCPALLAQAGRAGLGGPREALLGAVMAVRLVHGIRLPWPLDPAVRAARAEAARQWLVAVTMPAKTRTALQRAFATSASGDPATAADALEVVTEVTLSHLDKAARAELVRLVTALRADAAQLAGDRDRAVE